MTGPNQGDGSLFNTFCASTLGDASVDCSSWLTHGNKRFRRWHLIAKEEDRGGRLASPTPSHYVSLIGRLFNHTINMPVSK